MTQATDDTHIPIAALEAQLRQREHEIALLRETAFAIGSELDLDTVFALIVDRAPRTHRRETVLLPAAQPRLRPIYLPCRFRRQCRRDRRRIIAARLRRLRLGVEAQATWWRGVLSELSEQEKNLWEKDAGTLLLVPLVGRDHFLGGIAGINKAGGGEFSENDLHLLELFAGHAAIAIEKRDGDGAGGAGPERRGSGAGRTGNA